jgi:hypothetical protein
MCAAGGGDDRRGAGGGEYTRGAGGGEYTRGAGGGEYTRGAGAIGRGAGGVMRCGGAVITGRDGCGGAGRKTGRVGTIVGGCLPPADAGGITRTLLPPLPVKPLLRPTGAV